MKEALVAHPWIGPGSKGVLGATLPLALLSWANVGEFWQELAGAIAGTILVLTLANVVLEVRHKWRRDKKERDRGKV